MASSTLAANAASAASVRVTAAHLVVELTDGRAVSVPLSWYPRLAEGTPSERRRWTLLGGGLGIHWPDLDEDIEVEALLLGQPSNESAASLRRWRSAKNTAERRPASTNPVKRKPRPARP